MISLYIKVFINIFLSHFALQLNVKFYYLSIVFLIIVHGHYNSSLGVRHSSRFTRLPSLLAKQHDSVFNTFTYQPKSGSRSTSEQQDREERNKSFPIQA